MTSEDNARTGAKKIKFKLLTHLALSSLTNKKLRSFLTITGVVIGIGSIFMLLSFGVGLRNLVERQITDGVAINTIDISATNSDAVRLSKDKLNQIARIDGVDDMSKIFVSAGKLSSGGSSISSVIYLIDDLYLKLDSSIVVAGRKLDAAKTGEAMISSSLMEVLGFKDAKSVINKEIDLEIEPDSDEPIRQKFKIIGVTNVSTGSEVFVSSKMFEHRGSDYSQARVTVVDRGQIAEVRHHIEGLGFDTASPIDTIEQVDQVFRVFSVILALLGGIGMIIAILGMINTLTVSLLERTKEIALMLMIGARPKDMLWLFIYESVILSIIGWFIGVVLSIGIGKLVDIALNHFSKIRGADMSFTVFAYPAWLIFGSFAFMVTVGILVAIIPAIRASRVNTVAALREG